MYVSNYDTQTGDICSPGQALHACGTPGNPEEGQKGRDLLSLKDLWHALLGYAWLNKPLLSTYSEHTEIPNKGDEINLDWDIWEVFIAK